MMENVKALTAEHYSKHAALLGVETLRLLRLCSRGASPASRQVLLVAEVKKQSSRRRLVSREGTGEENGPWGGGQTCIGYRDRSTGIHAVTGLLDMKRGNWKLPESEG